MPLRFPVLFRILAAGAFLSAALILGNCSKKSSPTDPGDNGNTPGRTLDAQTRTVDAGGGSIVLKDGTSVVIPAGALVSSGEVKVATVDPATYFDGGTGLERVIISCTAPVTQFAKEVEIRVPLPAGMTEADSTKVFSGLIDEESGAVTVERSTVRMIGGKPFLVIPTTHFSSRLAEWFFGQDPPASAGPLTVPYYNQGSSQYCWAASVQMVTQAAKFSETSEVFDIIGKMGVNEGGITSLSFRFSSTLAGLIKNRTGYKPDRNTWDYININQMKEYLKREIGLRGHPVALFNGVWEHAVVIVGYSGNTFHIHDPASATASAIGYTSKTWDDIAGKMSLASNMVTLSIPSPSLDANRSEVTANIMPDAFDFILPGVNGASSKYYRFAWEYRKPGGYAFRENADAPVDSLPSLVSEIRQRGDIEVYNASRTASQSVSVWLDITAAGAPKGEGHYSDNKSLTLSPNSSSRVDFGTIPVEEFRWNSASPTKYYFSVSVLAAGKTVDRATVEFVIPPAPLNIKSVEPKSAAPGSVITLKGTGFGDKKSTYWVYFGVGSDYEIPVTDSLMVVSWKDTEIKIKVPPKSGNGDIELRERGWGATKKSNRVPFTPDDAMTLTGTMRVSPVWPEVGVFGNFTVAWELTASYPDTLVYDNRDSHDLDITVKTKSKAMITAKYTYELVLKKRTTYSWWDSTRIEENFRDLKPSELQADPKGTSPTIRVNGTFPYTIDGSGDTFKATCDLNRGQYYTNDNIRLMPWFEFKVDTDYYSLKHADYGALIKSVKDRRG
ncbi:MAG: IPT/TIG domain-containing protein, partial [Candidatus Latescibacterota bacterium]